MLNNMSHTQTIYLTFKKQLISLGLCLLLISCCWADKSYEPLIEWQAINNKTTTAINHHDWQVLLTKYVSTPQDGINRFNYSAVTTEDNVRLEKYLSSLQSIDPRDYSFLEQKAYWINLYNAITVQLVLKEYPVRSILFVGKSFLPKGPWDLKVANIAGKQLSLNDIEHRILRPIWQDYKIHFAVNCASLGCPNLQTTAFTGPNITLLLNNAAKDYINHPRGLRFEKNTLILSSIFKWYRSDFGKDEKAVIKELKQYLKRETSKQLENFNGTVKYKYNWKLNSP